MKTKIILIVLSSILLSLSFPPWEFFYLAFFALVPLFYVLSGTRFKEAIFYCLLFSAIFVIFLLGWLINALESRNLEPIVIIAIYSLIVLVLFSRMLIFSYIFKYAERSPHYLNILFIPACWIAIDSGFSYLLPSNNWILLGYSQYKNLAFIQAADITGVSGATFLIVLINYLIFKIFISQKKKALIAVVILIILINLGYGLLLLKNTTESGRKINVAFVQTRVSKEINWMHAKNFAETFDTLFYLTREAAKNKPDLIIWPEGSIPFPLAYSERMQELIASIQNETGRYLLSGTTDYEDSGSRLGFNAAFLISPEGKTIEKYYKQKLVPIVESPIEVLFSLSNKAANISPCIPGKGSNLLMIPKACFGVGICWESIFPKLTRKLCKKGALFLIIMTNDYALFSKAGAKQHFIQSVFRAIESRKWLIRCSSIGISVFISPTGRLYDASAFHEDICRAKDIFLIDKRSFYSKYGDVFSCFCLLFSLFFIVLKKVKK